MESFLKEAIGSIRTSGTIRPSSKHLIRDCLKDIDFDSARTLVEFGPGDGCITERIIDLMHPEARLFSFELNTNFFDYCSGKFSRYPDVQIIHANALQFQHILAQFGHHEVDHVISSLPLMLLNKSDKKQLLDRVTNALKPGGYFIQYQYSFGAYLQLKKAFDRVKLDVTFRNLPPAVVYKCRMDEAHG